MDKVPVKAYNGFSVEELRQQLLLETDTTNIKDIVRQLNAHLQKKDIIRKSELSDLQDKVQEQIQKRIVEKGNSFSNKDLLDYFKVIDDTINKIDSTQEVQAPQLKVNQQFNINMDKPSMTREEKMQVVDAVKAIIERVQQEQQDKNIINGEYLEINDERDK